MPLSGAGRAQTPPQHLTKNPPLWRVFLLAEYSGLESWSRNVETQLGPAQPGEQFSLAFIFPPRIISRGALSYISKHDKAISMHTQPVANSELPFLSIFQGALHVG